jgi:hypothetical protein
MTRWSPPQQMAIFNFSTEQKKKKVYRTAWNGRWHHPTEKSSLLMVYYVVLPLPLHAGSITPILKSTSSFPLISKEENMAEIASCNHSSLSLYPNMF